MGPILGMGLLSKKHVLSLLLLMEAAAIALFVGSLIGLSVSGRCEMVLLVVAVRACEAAVGLGILIALARAKGNDFVDVRIMVKV